MPERGVDENKFVVGERVERRSGRDEQWEQVFVTSVGPVETTKDACERYEEYDPDALNNFDFGQTPCAGVPL